MRRQLEWAAFPGLGGLLRLRTDRRVQEAVFQQDPENMVSLVACVPLHIDERDHLFDQLWPFEELDIAFIGIGFNIATLPVADWRDNEDVLERPVPTSSFTAFVAGVQVKFSSCGQSFQ